MDIFEGDIDRELIVEFRAGKMNMVGKLVTADPRKGLITILQNPEGIINFIWKDRSTNVLEDNFIIFPKEAEFKKVPQCTSGRVFLLKFINADKKYFYWMQEPKDDDDEFIYTLVNYVLKHPPQPVFDLYRPGTQSLEDLTDAEE